MDKIKVRESASVVRDHTGKPLYYDGTLKDITEQKRAEEGIKLAEAIVDRATVGIFVIGPDGSINSVNGHACKSLGYTREELLAMNVFDIDPGLSAEKWKRHRSLVEKELRDTIARVKPHIKTFFMSGYTANVIAHRGILDEGIHFIQKPFTPRTLARKVRDVLQARGDQ
ncbi:MAG: PAS domain S-box protein [Bacteroidetes bacterium]|nr:PAS domain S-box protein [Bacteroidota bacterium]